jgi:hypothetical protein
LGAAAAAAGRGPAFAVTPFPLHVVHGRHDTVVPPAHSDALYGGLKWATVERVEDGHQLKNWGTADHLRERISQLMAVDAATLSKL